MYVYAGIDEAGYGPILGPLLVGCSVLGIDEKHIEDGQPPDIWELLSKSVCKKLSGAKGRIALADSKKLRTKAAGIGHLEKGVLAFSSLTKLAPADVGSFLDRVGQTEHRHLEHMPWYQPTSDWPWDTLPVSITPGELGIARNVLQHDTREAGIDVLAMRANVVFEDVFNRMVKATRSKASVSFTFVAGHLRAIWDAFGDSSPFVAVDRQSGRQRYRDLLTPVFPEARITVTDESPEISAYELIAGNKKMHVCFRTDCETHHFPVALASMLSKYTRELFMHRFNSWFAERLPDVKPTAGYAQDGKRFLDEVRPSLRELGITEEALVRVS